jgi:hypothetical protein
MTVQPHSRILDQGAPILVKAGAATTRSRHGDLSMLRRPAPGRGSTLQMATERAAEPLGHVTGRSAS